MKRIQIKSKLADIDGKWLLVVIKCGSQPTDADVEEMIRMLPEKDMHRLKERLVIQRRAVDKQRWSSLSRLLLFQLAVSDPSTFGLSASTPGRKRRTGSKDYKWLPVHMSDDIGLLALCEEKPKPAQRWWEFWK